MSTAVCPGHDMGPNGTQIGSVSKSVNGNKGRKFNHHFSLKDRIRNNQQATTEKHPRADVCNQETRKAAAWAVFQHHTVGVVTLNQAPAIAIRRPSRFKIEAQMRRKISHRSMSDTVAASWDAGSTLFDSFELDSLLKTLDDAVNPAAASQQDTGSDAAVESGAIVTYSQNQWLSRSQPSSQRRGSTLTRQRSLVSLRDIQDIGRLDTVDETRPLETSLDLVPVPHTISYKLADNVNLDELLKPGRGHDDADDDPFAAFSHTPSPFNVRRSARRSFDTSAQSKSGKGGSFEYQRRSKWRTLFRTLHLDGANGLFNRFPGFHSQVAPHDSLKKLERKGDSRRAKSELIDTSYSHEHHNSHSEKPLEVEQADPKNLRVSTHVNPPSSEKNGHRRNNNNNNNDSGFWKFGLKAVFSRTFSRPSHMSIEKESDTEEIAKVHQHQGHNNVDLQLAWTSLNARLHQEHHLQKDHQPGLRKYGKGKNRRGELPNGTVLEAVAHHEHHHHHHHHHHHVPTGDEDYELPLPAITRRISRSSFDEKVRRFSTEDSCIQSPRNSYEQKSTSENQRIRTQLASWEV